MSAIINRKLKVVKVQYCLEEVFKIPVGMDLEDKSQVKYWGVKWNKLYIHLITGEDIEIEPYWDTPNNFDFKRPDDTQIEDDNYTERDSDDDEPIIPIVAIETAETAPVPLLVIPPVPLVKVSTWEEVCEKIRKYMDDNKGDTAQRRLVYSMFMKICEVDYNKMKKITDILLAIEGDYCSDEWDLPKDKRKKIYEIGLNLHSLGGKELQQLCFYMAVNFMSNDKRLKAIEIAWDGAGEWVY